MTAKNISNLIITIMAVVYGLGLIALTLANQPIGKTNSIIAGCLIIILSLTIYFKEV